MIDETKTLQRFITGSALRGLVHGSRIKVLPLMHERRRRRQGKIRRRRLRRRLQENSR